MSASLILTPWYRIVSPSITQLYRFRPPHSRNSPKAGTGRKKRTGEKIVVAMTPERIVTARTVDCAMRSARLCCRRRTNADLVSAMLGIFCGDHGSTVILRSGHLERESQEQGQRPKDINEQS